MSDVLFKKEEGEDSFEFLNGLIEVQLYDYNDKHYIGFGLTLEDTKILFHKMKEFYEPVKELDYPGDPDLAISCEPDYDHNDGPQ